MFCLLISQTCRLKNALQFDIIKFILVKLVSVTDYKYTKVIETMVLILLQFSSKKQRFLNLDSSYEVFI